jgi:hypothetical protein
VKSLLSIGRDNLDRPVRAPELTVHFGHIRFRDVDRLVNVTGFLAESHRGLDEIPE